MKQSVEIDAEQFAEIKRLACKYGITVEECIRKLLKRAITDVRLAEAMSL